MLQALFNIFVVERLATHPVVLILVVGRRGEERRAGSVGGPRAFYAAGCDGCGQQFRSCGVALLELLNLHSLRLRQLFVLGSLFEEEKK